MILIIGGTGKVGSELVKQMAETKSPARVLVRNAEKAKKVEGLGLEVVVGDLTNLISIEDALKGIEKMFLLTPPSPNEADLKNSIIEIAKRTGVDYVVLLSGAGADLNSPISQAQQHAKSEAYLKASGLAFTILRPYFFMQNFFNQADTIKGNFGGGIKSEGAIYGNFKDGKIAMVDTRDIAAVALACLTENGHNGQTYIITGGETITNAEAAEKLSTVLGKKINYVDIPSEHLIKGMTSVGTPEWLARDLSMLGDEFASGKFANTTDVIERVTNKKPITFDQFAKDYAKAFY